VVGSAEVLPRLTDLRDMGQVPEKVRKCLVTAQVAALCGVPGQC